MSEKLLSNKARKRLRMTRFPTSTVARKYGTHGGPDTKMQSHMDSIHSPHNTMKTIMNLCMKSTKFQRGSSLDGKRSVLSEIEWIVLL